MGKDASTIDFQRAVASSNSGQRQFSFSVWKDSSVAGRIYVTLISSEDFSDDYYDVRIVLNYVII